MQPNESELEELAILNADTGGYPIDEDLKKAVIAINNFLRYGDAKDTQYSKGLRYAKSYILKHKCAPPAQGINEEMLDALKDMIELAEMCEYGGEPISENNFKKAKEAIARATGGKL